MLTTWIIPDAGGSSSTTAGRCWCLPAPVLTEVCWLLEREKGSDVEAAFLDALEAGEMELVDLTKADLRRMAELVRQYSSLPLGAVDASVVAVAFTLLPENE
jgi:predicted nucleic acid-binding protein